MPVPALMVRQVSIPNVPWGVSREGRQEISGRHIAKPSHKRRHDCLRVGISDKILAEHVTIQGLADGCMVHSKEACSKPEISNVGKLRQLKKEGLTQNGVLGVNSWWETVEEQMPSISERKGAATVLRRLSIALSSCFSAETFCREASRKVPQISASTMASVVPDPKGVHGSRISSIRLSVLRPRSDKKTTLAVSDVSVPSRPYARRRRFASGAGPIGAFLLLERFLSS